MDSLQKKLSQSVNKQREESQMHDEETNYSITLGHLNDLNERVKNLVHREIGTFFEPFQDIWTQVQLYFLTHVCQTESLNSNVLLSNMEKKISFAFNKTSKKSNLFVNKLAPKEDKNDVELIKCLEGQSIQLVEEKLEEAPLIIPLRSIRKTSAALHSLKTRQAVLIGEELPPNNCKTETAEIKDEISSITNESDDIEKRAAKELLAEVGGQENDLNSVSKLVLPVKSEDLPLDGAKEPTIDDYESIPITQFGLAMLRGMGWKDQPKVKGAPIEDGPIMRPKGMGLGADKALKSRTLLVPPEANEILAIKKGACVRILGGKHKELYGRIEGLDEHAGRVIVKMALGSIKESFNEFMVQPVSKKEYAQYSKCINTAKYDEYKRMEDENGQIMKKMTEIKKETEKCRTSGQTSKNTSDESQRKYDRKKCASSFDSPESDSNSRRTERRSRSREKRSENYFKSSTSHKKYRRTPSRNGSKSRGSSSSESSRYQSKHKKKSSKNKKNKKSNAKSRERRHSSEPSSDDDRRYKKKTKKSKRGRSRSRSKGRR